jgi:ribosomal protection tetracycline resistance protein
MARTLNLGILAHVDAGKTTLTERLLYAAGVIDAPGSVDKGTTRTDSLDLERQRGITIKTAVVSFPLDGVTVNLVDTPGHPDFIAEVERSLSILDGAVLVLSAVEGVQSQTRLLMRALQRLRVPTLLFVNKIDRTGARDDDLLAEIKARLTPGVVAMGDVDALGTRDARFVAATAGDDGFRAMLAETLAERDDSLLAAFVEDDAIPYGRLRTALAAQTSRSLVHPLFFGSAITGAGVEALMAGIAELLPAADGDADAPASGTVFKIERGAVGEKIAYVRMFAGAVRVRDRVRVGADSEQKVTALEVFARGAAEQSSAVSAGEIAKLWGLAEARIGDAIGEPSTRRLEHHFTPPTLEAVVVPATSDDRARLGVALGQLAEQDPLIAVRQNVERREISVCLYGEVQKEVIQATLAAEFGVEVSFRETTTIYIERPAATASSLETLQDETNPFLATIGLRVEPAAPGSGVSFQLDLDPRLVPLYLYGSADRFAEVIARLVRRTLQEGLRGWEVTDCAVALTDCDYYIGDGQGKRPGGGPHLHGSGTEVADFRRLTPMVLMQALAEAGTLVCEPIARVRIEAPAGSLSAVLPALARLGGRIAAPVHEGGLSVIEVALPFVRVHDLQRQLPGLTGGEGVLESELAGYEPVTGEPPIRRRTTPNPLNREEYVMHIARRTTRTAVGN